MCECYFFINFLKIHGKVFSHFFGIYSMAMLFWQIAFAIIFPVLFLIFLAIFFL